MRKMLSVAMLACSMLLLPAQDAYAFTGNPWQTNTIVESYTGTENSLIHPRDMDIGLSSDSEAMIQVIPKVDAEGYVTVTMSAAEDVVLPVTVVMKGSEGSVSFTLEESGQKIKVKPDAYKITKVTDGNGKKRTAGARLTITEDSEAVYLDFNKPEGNNTIAQTVLENFLFIPVAVIIYFALKKYFSDNF